MIIYELKGCSGNKKNIGISISKEIKTEEIAEQSVIMKEIAWELHNWLPGISFDALLDEMMRLKNEIPYSHL